MKEEKKRKTSTPLHETCLLQVSTLSDIKDVDSIKHSERERERERDAHRAAV